MPHLVLFLLFLNSAFGASQKFVTCDLVKTRELKNEMRIIRRHPGIAVRTKTHLSISLQNGKKIEMEDSAEGSDNGFQIHRVIGIGSKNDWIALFEPGRDSFGYRLIHPQSGQIEEFGGCPIWSADGHYFVALHEDLDSGQTQNEASLWYCADPATSCTKIWSDTNGGHSALWTGTHAEVVLSELNPATTDESELHKTVLCKPEGKAPGCSDEHPWTHSNTK